MNPLVSFNGQEASPSNVLWSAIRVQLDRNSTVGHSLHPWAISSRLDLIVPSQVDGQRREYDADDLSQLFLT